MGHSLLRKVNPARLLARRANGIFIADNRKAGIGSDLFRAACGMGLEAIVSSAPGFPGRPVTVKKELYVADHDDLVRTTLATGRP